MLPARRVAARARGAATVRACPPPSAAPSASALRALRRDAVAPRAGARSSPLARRALTLARARSSRGRSSPAARSSRCARSAARTRRAARGARSPRRRRPASSRSSLGSGSRALLCGAALRVAFLAGALPERWRGGGRGRAARRASRPGSPTDARACSRTALLGLVLRRRRRRCSPRRSRSAALRITVRAAGGHGVRAARRRGRGRAHARGRGPARALRRRGRRRRARGAPRRAAAARPSPRAARRFLARPGTFVLAALVFGVARRGRGRRSVEAFGGVATGFAAGRRAIARSLGPNLMLAVAGAAVAAAVDLAWLGTLAALVVRDRALTGPAPERARSALAGSCADRDLPHPHARERGSAAAAAESTRRAPSASRAERPAVAPLASTTRPPTVRPAARSPRNSITPSARTCPPMRSIASPRDVHPELAALEVDQDLRELARARPRRATGA